MNIHSAKIGLLNTSQLTGLPVSDLIEELSDASNMHLSSDARAAIKEVYSKYGANTEKFIAKTMYPFLASTEAYVPDEFQSINNFDASPDDIFNELSEFLWYPSAQAELAFGNPKEQHIPMPRKKLNKVRGMVKGTLKKVRAKDVTVSKKDVAVYSNNQKLKNILKFAAQKRGIPSKKLPAMLRMLGIKFAKLTKVAGRGAARKAMNGLVKVMNIISKSKPLKEESRFRPRVRPRRSGGGGASPGGMRGAGTGRAGQRLSYFMMKYVGLPITILVSIPILYSSFPIATACALGAVGVAFVFGILNKFSKKK